MENLIQNLIAISLGMMIFFSFILAPMIFKILDHENAGKFVRKIFPYGVANIKAVKGGLDISKEHVSEVTIIANAGIEVSFDMERN